jgi:hypothetical protein
MVKRSNQIARIMSKEMDRKDFLKYSGGVLLAVIGVTSLLSTLSRLGGDSHENESKDTYGSSPYGR